MVLDVTNAFIHTKMPSNKYGEERVIMKITCVLLDMLVELDSQTYRKHVVFENVMQVIYVVVLRKNYGMLVSELLFSKKFGGDLENIGFEFNTYNTCVVNSKKVGKKHTLGLHVEGGMCIHVNPKVNDKLKE